ATDHGAVEIDALPESVVGQARPTLPAHLALAGPGARRRHGAVLGDRTNLRPAARTPAHLDVGDLRAQGLRICAGRQAQGERKGASHGGHLTAKFLRGRVGALSPRIMDGTQGTRRETKKTQAENRGMRGAVTS